MQIEQYNIVFVLTDQWRAQSCGYAGDKNVKTPNLDKFSKESINFSNAISGCPASTPYRGSLMSGQRPLTNGLFVNNVGLKPKGPTIAQSFLDYGYNTALIGKFHVDGKGRESYIPPERHLGFQYWKAVECCHDYNNSTYFASDYKDKLKWEGYDAIAQTEEACEFMIQCNGTNPFFLMLSFGPPHDPYDSAPQEFKKQNKAEQIELRKNVPVAVADKAKQDIAGYNSHIQALDTCFGNLLNALDVLGLKENTIVVFTSTHGDMLGSQGHEFKQKPWVESMHIPCLMRIPGQAGKEIADAYIDAPDIMPTLLSLCGFDIPEEVEGVNYADYIKGGENPSDSVGIGALYQPFGQFNKNNKYGTRKEYGREWRSIETHEYMYAHTLEGPWLLYNKEKDPFQINNLVNEPEFAHIVEDMKQKLFEKLKERNDDFQQGKVYLKQWGYKVDQTGSVPFSL